MAVSVLPVVSKADLKEFIQLPPRLYKNFPNYTAPLTLERKGLLDPKKSAFFSHGKAQYWIAYKNNRTVGRISAQIDDAQPAGAFDGAGLFGSLDAIDDEEVVKALLEAAEDWLRAQRVKRAFGPCLLSMNEEPGLLVDGHDEPPMIMVPWHPPYLERHLEACGYRQCRDLHFWRIDVTEAGVREITRHNLPSLREAGYVVRSLNMGSLRSEVEIFRHVYNDAWKDNWGFVPIEPADLEGLSSDLKPFLHKDYGVIVEKEGRPIAIALILPNLFEITGDLGANPSLLGWGKFAIRTFSHSFRTGRLVLFGILSEFQQSIGGAIIAMGMIEEIVLRKKEYEFEWVEAGWVLDNNRPMIKILKQFNFRRTRTLRLFDKVI